MTPQQRERVRAMSKELYTLSEELDCKTVSNLFMATRVAPDGTFILAANSDGFIYLASILTSLAAEQSLGQHYHYDQSSILSECQKKLVIKFEFAPWEQNAG